MSIIKELLEPRTVMLTNIQKAVLAAVFNSPTPEAAFEAINGSPALVTARNILERLGLISIESTKASLTDEGNAAIVANNIADESGQLTDVGTALIDKINAVRKDYKVVESFELLKTIF